MKIYDYAEFEYAHMALKYNVENYLLKPVNKEELENNLRQIVTRLDHETKDREAQKKTEHKLRMNKELLKQHIFGIRISVITISGRQVRTASRAVAPSMYCPMISIPMLSQSTSLVGYKTDAVFNSADTVAFQENSF